jgi:MFS transporter, MHS family, alpha-ketoglutarate permease
LVSQLISALMPAEAFASWGWRIPFVVGALLAVCGFVLRTKASETPVFEQIRRDRELDRVDGSGLRHHWLACIRVASINLATLPYYLWTTFLPTYAHLTTGVPLSEAFVANAVALAVFAAVLPLAGALSDRVGRKPLLLTGAVGFILGTYPMLTAVRQGGFVTLLLVSLAGCLLLACSVSVMAATFSELVPAHIRVTGIGIPYSITGAVFGGTAPLLSATFISAGAPDLISDYVIVVMTIAAVAWISMPETRFRAINAPAAR